MASCTQSFKTGPPPEPVEKQIERDRITGETMSRYIEQYRDTGVALFDQLVAGGYIVADNRGLSQWA